ncbi:MULTISPECIES: hypothetical protein [Niallia]|nr:hypothetical protein [Niallia circulans]MED3837637.1 hypothetical protein [Niallia circulans]MED4244707.1 hypothetical protein [Niallia circulans]MED4249809.1 hypothetical protein [Niallia circulans]MED5102379.1 hypothetical protein [Niallia circulans]
MIRKIVKGYLDVVVLPLTFFISIIFEPSGNLVRLTNDTIRDM